MKKPIIFIFIVLLHLQLFSAEPSVMALIRSKYSSNAAIETQFELRTYWSVREREDVKSGHLYSMSENRFRIELGGEVLVSDGTTYWQYSKNSAQVVINNLSEVDQSILPSKILSTYLTQYAFKEKSRTNKEIELMWRADSGAQTNYTAIDIGVVTKTGEVLKLQLTDRNSNIQTYTFKKSTFGAKIPKAVFTFEVPENAQILDNRK